MKKIIPTLNYIISNCKSTAITGSEWGKTKKLRGKLVVEVRATIYEQSTRYQVGSYVEPSTALLKSIWEIW